MEGVRCGGVLENAMVEGPSWGKKVCVWGRGGVGVGEGKGGFEIESVDKEARESSWKVCSSA